MTSKGWTMFNRLGRWFRRALKFGPVHPRDPVLAAWFGGAETAAGITVDETTALNCSAIWAAVRVLSETIGALPLLLYRRLPEGGKVRAPEHPAYRLARDEPNPEMTAIVCKETLQAHVLLWGNLYAEIERDGAGRPVALWPLPPNRVTPDRDEGGELIYVLTRNTGGQITFRSENVLHIPGLGFDGLTGYSVVTMARESFGLGLATERYGAGFFGSGSLPGGVLEHPGALTKEAKRNLRESWEEMHQGAKRAHRIAILEEGMKFHALGIPPEDAQFLETRKFQVTEVARWFNIPPHMLRDLERATFSNVEQQALDFLTYSLTPWLVRWEQEFKRKLLTAADRDTFFFEHLVDALLRGDTLTRYQAHKIALDSGFKNIDEVREIENLNPLPAGQGKVYRVPLNTAPVGATAEEE
jgi:HK97 family phage portal protein